MLDVGSHRDEPAAGLEAAAGLTQASSDGRLVWQVLDEVAGEDKIKGVLLYAMPRFRAVLEEEPNTSGEFVLGCWDSGPWRGGFAPGLH